MDEYFGVAKDLGVSREEIEIVQSIVMAVAGGQIQAQFLEARMQGAERRRAGD